jgi:hypothetical protein
MDSRFEIWIARFGRIRDVWPMIHGENLVKHFSQSRDYVDHLL